MSIGIVVIQIPLPSLSLLTDVKFLLLLADGSTLLCMNNLIQNVLDISIQLQKLHLGSKSQPFSMENYFIEYSLQLENISFPLYTQEELRHINRVSGQHAIRPTKGLLRRAKGSAISDETRAAIWAIPEPCTICRIKQATPSRFTWTTGTNDLRFNNTVKIDTIFYKASRYYTWRMWPRTFVRRYSERDSQLIISGKPSPTNGLCYMPAPDYLHVDQCSAYVSREMRQNKKAEVIDQKEAPIETTGSPGTAESYQAPLHAFSERIWVHINPEFSYKECPTMAVFALNQTIGPEGFVDFLTSVIGIPTLDVKPQCNCRRFPSICRTFWTKFSIQFHIWKFKFCWTAF